PEYEGYVEMKLLDYDGRSIMQEKAAAMIPKDVIEKVKQMKEQGSDGEELATSSSGQATLRALVKLLPEVIVKIDITRLDDGCKIETWEDIQYEGGLHHVLTELASVMMGKQRLTKQSVNATA